MKLYEVVLFLLIFNVVLSMVNSANVFGTGVNPACNYDQPWIAEIQAAGQSNMTSLTNTPVQTITSWFWGSVQAIITFVGVISNATVLLPSMLQNCMYLPPDIANAITAVVWFIYVVGMVQLWRGMSMKNTE